MRAVVDHQRREAELARPRRQRRGAEREGGRREAPAGVDAQHGRPVVGQHRLGAGRDLAGPDRAQAALDAVDAVRLAGVALARHDHRGHRRSLGGRQTGLAEDRPDAFTELGDGQAGRDGHFGLPGWRTGVGPAAHNVYAAASAEDTSAAATA